MNFYSFDEIKQAGNCIRFVEECLGQEVKHGRCAAVWRGGDGQNVAVKEDEWHDHVAKVGGGIIELCATAKFGGDVQQAQDYLGEWLHLKPKMLMRPSPTESHYSRLIADGYKEVKRYEYRDLDGKLIHFVARMEHPEKPKEFSQGTPSGWSLRGTKTILYRLKDWVSAPSVCIVEGEKDADTLNDIGIPATTNCGGAEKWSQDYNPMFDGKRVIIIRDNDEAGEKHAIRVARELKGHASTIMILCPSALPKGDVTDWIKNEGGTREKLIELVKASKPVDPDTLEAIDPACSIAKAANKSDFANFTEHQEQVGPAVKVIKSPRQINAIIEDVHKRFLGFPRRIGGSKVMFDHDRDTHEIVIIHEPADLFSWIGRKSKRRIAWGIGDAFVTKAELFRGLVAESQVYEAISTVPDWPRRPDVYYAHHPMPKPSDGHQYFHDLVDFFDPADDGNKTMLKALIMAPIWYIRDIPRPGWIIDSEDGAGTGKTTLVELISKLYRSNPIRTNRQELKTASIELIKRIVSHDGRQCRILLVDNVTGEFHCAELSDFMTASSISGKAPYGRGEETRPNNLTYVITANSATVDNDLSDRCYYVKVAKPRRSGNWKRDVLEYIEKFRMNIFADIIDMIERRDPIECEPQTRFPEFEETILRAACDDEEEYRNALATLMESRAVSNVEDEHAKTIEDEFTTRLIECGRAPGSEMIFIRSEVVKAWVDEILGREINCPGVQYLRNLAKNGLLQRFAVKPERYPHNGPKRRRGIMWMPVKYDQCEPHIIGMKGNKVVEVV